MLFPLQNLFFANLRNENELIRSNANITFVALTNLSEENLNYMGAFEKLVQRSDGEYIAFCDIL